MAHFPVTAYIIAQPYCYLSVSLFINNHKYTQQQQQTWLQSWMTFSHWFYERAGLVKGLIQNCIGSLFNYDLDITHEILLFCLPLCVHTGPTTSNNNNNGTKWKMKCPPNKARSAIEPDICGEHLWRTGLPVELIADALNLTYGVRFKIINFSYKISDISV